MTDEGERGGAENATTGEQPVESAGAPSSEKPGLVRLKWLKINKYRNVRPGTELRFDDGFNVVLGMNGSGKTTLLKLLAAVISSNFWQLTDPYDLTYELELAGILLRGRAWVDAEVHAPGAAGAIASAARARFGDAEIPSTRRRFDGVFHHRSTGRAWELLIAHDGATLRHGSESLDLPPELTFGDKPALWPIVVASVAVVGPPGIKEISLDTREAMAAVTATVRRLDESLETLGALTSGGGDGGSDLLECPVISAAGDPSRMRAPGPTGAGAGGFWLRLPTGASAPDTRGLSAALEVAGALAELPAATGLHFGMTVRFLRTQPLGSDFLYSYQGLSFNVRHASGETTTHNVLSYGQKRLLTFLYYLAVNDYVVIADELVNGLHHSWIKLCLDQIELGQRQAFLTSQNPLLLDYLPPSSVEQAQRQYIECRAEGDELVWANMSREDAESVLSAYDVGVQRLSEVLATKGLW